jgi:hypothetical protein
MRCKSILLTALVLSVHCSKGSSPPPAPPAPPVPEGASAETPPATAEPEPAAEERRVEVTEARVARYVVYLTEDIQARRVLLAQYGADAARIDKEKGLKQGVDALASAQQLQRASDEAEKRALARSGLSAEEVAALAPAVGDVIMLRMTLSQGGAGTGVSEMEKQMRAAIEKLPADQRAEAEKELAETTQGMKDRREGKEARQKYGDQAVDAILEHEAELNPLLKQAMGAPGGAK